MNGMVITKQNSPNKITADNESATKLWNDVRILISTPKEHSVNFTNAHSHHLILRGEGRPRYLAGSKLIMCLILIMPQK